MDLEDVGEENDRAGFLEEPRSFAWCYSLVRQICRACVGKDCRWMDLDAVGEESGRAGFRACEISHDHG